MQNNIVISIQYPLFYLLPNANTVGHCVLSYRNQPLLLRKILKVEKWTCIGFYVEIKMKK